MLVCVSIHKESKVNRTDGDLHILIEGTQLTQIQVMYPLDRKNTCLNADENAVNKP